MRYRFYQYLFLLLTMVLVVVGVKADPAPESIVIITEKTHHIGDGRFGTDSDSADRLLMKSEGLTFRAEFVIFEANIEVPVLEIEELYGHDTDNPPLQVLINLRAAGEIHDNGRDLKVPIPVDLLKLNGKKNIIQIVSPSSDNDVDDLEFRNVQLKYRASPAVNSKTTPVTLKASWEPPAGEHPQGWRINNFTKEVIPYKAQAGQKLNLMVDVDAAPGASALPDLNNASVQISVHDMSGSRISRQTLYPTFDSNGIAHLHLDAAQVLSACGSKINHNVLEANVSMTLDGHQSGAVTSNLAHVLRQKLILFIPGVFGSAITVASHPNEEAYPEWSIWGTIEFLWLACQKDGDPASPASRLDLFRSFATTTVYDVEHRIELKNPPGYPTLYHGGTADSNQVPYFIVKAWPYDWRLKVEHHVQSLMRSAGRSASDPVWPPYAAPPSLAEVVREIKKDERYRYYIDDKIALACHSTGGLITRGVLLQPGVERYVDRAFYINVPFWGAPKSYYVFLTGDMGIAFIANKYIRQLAPNIPVVYYLAPSEKYPDTVTAFLTPDKQWPVDRRVPGQPVSVFMDQLIAGARQRGVYPPSSEIDPWNKELEKSARDFQSAISSSPPRIGIENVKVFWSNAGNNTPGSIYLTLTREGVMYHGVPGDGTVPLVSQRADFPQNSLIEIPSHPEHVASPNQPFVWNKVVEILDQQFNP